MSTMQLDGTISPEKINKQRIIQMISDTA